MKRMNSVKRQSLETFPDGPFHQLWPNPAFLETAEVPMPAVSSIPVKISALSCLFSERERAQKKTRAWNVKPDPDLKRSVNTYCVLLWVLTYTATSLSITSWLCLDGICGVTWNKTEVTKRKENGLWWVVLALSPSRGCCSDIYYFSGDS